MDYKKIATAVFTPMEIGTVGFTEQEAIELWVEWAFVKYYSFSEQQCAFFLILFSYGAENVDCYISAFTPLEMAVLEHSGGNPCFAKVVVNRADSNRVVGMHICSPNAGEVIQGYAVALRKNITYEVRVCVDILIYCTTTDNMSDMSRSCAAP